MKKISLVAACLAVVSSMAAAQPSTNFTGFLAGVKVGAGAVKVNAPITLSNGTFSNGVLTSPQFVTGFTNDKGKFDFLGQINVSYAMAFGGCYWTSLDIYGGADSAKVKVFDQTFNAVADMVITSKRRGFYGASVNLGAYINPTTLAYVGVGMESGQWKTTLNGAALLAVTSGAITAQTVSKNSAALALHFGMKSALGQRAALTMNYTYVAPKNLGSLMWSPGTGTGYTANGATGNWNQGATALKGSAQPLRAGVEFKIGG